MNVYKISYSDFDEYSFIFLEHEQYFSENELSVMVHECIKEILVNQEYDDSPCLYRIGDLFYNKNILMVKMIQKFGFKPFHFTTRLNLVNDKFFRENGIADIYQAEPHCEFCSFEDIGKNSNCPFKRQEEGG